METGWLFGGCAPATSQDSRITVTGETSGPASTARRTVSPAEM